MVSKKRLVIAFVLAVLVGPILSGCGSNSGSSDGGLFIATVTAHVTGLKGTGLVLLKNDGSELVIDSNGYHSFPTDSQMSMFYSYEVVVKTQPTSPDQTCYINNGKGGAILVLPILNWLFTVDVQCNLHALGGTVSGLTGSGLILENKGTDPLEITKNGDFVFSTMVEETTSYNVTVATQPSGQYCTVANGSGTVPVGDITDVAVTCVPAHAVGGSVTGLTGSGLVLQNSNGDTVPISGDGNFSFDSLVGEGFTYSIEVLDQPASPNQLCFITNGAGTMSGSEVTDIAVDCVPAYTIGGTVTGLAGSGLVLQNNGGDDLAITADGTFQFATTHVDTSPYAVSVKTQPKHLSQTCTVNSGSGSIAGADVTNVSVSCVTNSFTIGGTVSGLSGAGLVLRNNDGDDLLININGSFTFATELLDGSAYAVSLLTQPTTPAQECVLADTTGTLNGNDITDVKVICNNPWVWIGGSDLAAQPGVYDLGAENGDTPGARDGAVSWTDTAGNFWLFGGWGYDSAGTFGDLNDLWKYDPATGYWTWVAGSNVVDQAGVYGTKGVAAAENMPGGRAHAVSWIDSSGKLWLFGGRGIESTGASGDLNDLWQFDPATGYWTWVSGNKVLGGTGVYGSKGFAAPENIPGRRHDAVSWLGPDGRLWLFGGLGWDDDGTFGSLNDLWRYDPATGYWTWVSGSNTVDQFGSYGTKGAATSGNLPGARSDSVSWADSTGKLWLFSGVGAETSGNQARLNDLWYFNTATGYWAWVSGHEGVTRDYGDQGVEADTNVPSARYGAISWIDSSDTLWLFGGRGFDAEGTHGRLDEIWKFNPATGYWTWVMGKGANQPGVYGSVGVVEVGNRPGGRQDSVGWIDSSGNLWLFGGWGYDSAGTFEDLNDIWRVKP